MNIRTCTTGALHKLNIRKVHIELHMSFKAINHQVAP